MRVLIVNCVYDPEQIVSAKIGKTLAEKLAHEGHLVSVIAPFPSRPAGFHFDVKFKKGNINVEVQKPNLKIFRLPSFTSPKSNIIGRLWESISFGWHSYRYILNNSSEIDKVYMNTWPLFGQYGVSRACTKKNIPYVVHIQDVYPESLTSKLPKAFIGFANSFLFTFEKYVLKYASKVIVISKKMSAFISESRCIKKDSINVVLNWQDEKEFEQYENVWPLTKLTFMYLGNIGPVAGLPLILEAFANANLENARLVLAGSGSNKDECINVAKRYPNADIEFWDVPAGDVAKTQAEAHILLLPMIKGAGSSSIPSKLPAYMFSSRPIIVTADTGSDTSNAVVEANCGWIGEAEDINWLTKTMLKVSNLNSDELKTLGANGRSYSLKNFSKKVNLNQLFLTIVND